MQTYVDQMRGLVRHETMHSLGFANSMFLNARDAAGKRKTLLQLVKVTDVDGTFADQPFCAGCHVLFSSLIGGNDVFPDCYTDGRYSGSVCKPNYHFVAVGFSAKPPFECLSIPWSERRRGGVSAHGCLLPFHVSPARSTHQRTADQSVSPPSCAR